MPFREVGARVVDQDVQLPVPVREILCQLAHSRQRGKIGQHQLDGLIAALGLNLRHGCFSPTPVAANHHHGGAHLGQALGGLLADTGICTGNHIDSVVHVYSFDSHVALL